MSNFDSGWIELKMDDVDIRDVVVEPIPTEKFERDFEAFHGKEMLKVYKTIQERNNAMHIEKVKEK